MLPHPRQAVPAPHVRILSRKRPPCIACASFVGRRASVAQVVGWSGKVFTYAHVPAFERTHHTCTREPRHRVPLLRRVHYYLYACIARHAPCTFLVRTARCDGVVCPWRRLPRPHPGMVRGWRGGGRSVGHRDPSPVARGQPRARSPTPGSPWKEPGCPCPRESEPRPRARRCRAS
jgi:hypothetical protein